jgi:peptide/nickel transport system permease protein
MVLSVIAYLWIPDSSRYANRQIPEASLLNPGSVICYKKISITKSNQNIWSLIWNGDKSVYKYVVTTDNHTYGNQLECKAFLFGTDKYGRDVFSRIFVGLRYTLIIGFSAVILSLFIGMLLGSMAGYFGGKMDQFISVFINVFWSLPTILLAFAVILSFGRSMVSIFAAIGLTMWGDIARLVRAQVLSAKELLYVQAGKALGYSDSRILFKQILPNIMGPVWVAVAGNFALAVLLESGLSFLGFGLQPPIPTLGNILQEQYSYAVTGKPMLALIPSIVVVLLVLSFQLITNSLRDRGDVRMSVRK